MAVAEGDTLNVFNHGLDSLFRDVEDGTEYEYIYAIQDIADKILDLKIGESMYFQPNRDNDLTKGIITRHA